MIFRKTRAVAIAACLVAAAAGFAAAQDQGMLERAIKARQGLMNVHVWESGPLFAMAKGDMPYDAEIAAGHAAALNELTQYEEPRMFIPGTSTAEMPGETRALPAIWERPDEFRQAFDQLQEATTRVVEVAGDGQEALAAAVAEVGKSCGNCHQSFREKN